MAGNLPKRTVYAIGETVLDLVSEGNSKFRAIPGGSMLNSAVSLARMEVNMQFISELGDDYAGKMILDFLHRNGIKTDFSTCNLQYKTSIALAFLDESKNASYSFYHDLPDELTAAKLPEITQNDIFLFGSYYSVKPSRRNYLVSFLQKAIDVGSPIFYDLNIRKSHMPEMEELMPSYLNNMSTATIVKGSDEDFQNLFGISDPDKVYEAVSPFCENLIITAGENPLRFYTVKGVSAYDIPKIIPVSTIGAGDNFNAGFIYGLVTSGFDLRKIEDFPMDELNRIVGHGIAFSTETCMSEQNYIQGYKAQQF